MQVDTTTPGKSKNKNKFNSNKFYSIFLGNKDLSNSIFKTSGSYGGIAELYKTKV